MPYAGSQYYEEVGQGEPLVLLHGHTLDRRMWQWAAPLLEGFRLILPDLSGHGLSPLSPNPYAVDLVALLDRLGVERAAVAGLSMGGAAAVSLALHAPDRVRALIPVDAALFGHRMTQWPGPRPFAATARTAGLRTALDQWLADPVFTTAVHCPVGAEIREIVLQYPGAHWLADAPSPVPPGRPDAERLGDIAVPTLVVVGELDLPDFQVIADRLAAEIPGARKAVIPGAGHLSPVEQPEAFAAAVLSFLAEVPA